MTEMDNDLRQHIGEVFDGGFWEPVTGKLFQHGTPWELWKFERDVDFDGETWRCLILQKVNYDPDDPDAVDYAIDIFSRAWKL